MIWFLVLFILFLIAVVISPYALWRNYVAVMHLKKVRDAQGLTRLSELYGKIILYTDLAWDAFCNFTSQQSISGSYLNGASGL